MSFPRVVGIAGNLKRPSRTRALVEAVGTALAHRREVDFAIYDLLDAGPGLGAAYAHGDLTPAAARVVEAIETADALIVGPRSTRAPTQAYSNTCSTSSIRAP